MMPAEPPLTIGLPVLNGGATLRSALTSLVAQTRGDFLLMVSDNASSDDTAEIIREFAARDPRIRVVRQPQRLSAIDNFRSLIEAAETPYFMFAPADDWWDPRFVELTLSALMAEPAASLACPRIAMIGPGDARGLSTGTSALAGDVETRLRRYLRNPGDGSRFYGIHRREPLQRGFAALTPMPAFDWLVLVPGLLTGPHIEIEQVLMHRDATPFERYRDWVARLETNPVGRAVPNLRLAAAIFTMLPPPLRRSLLPDLAFMCLASIPNSPYAPMRALYPRVLAARRLLRGKAPN